MGDIFCCHHHYEEETQKVLEVTETTNVTPEKKEENSRVMSPTKHEWDFCEEKTIQEEVI
jgi:hypothetical protein